MGIMAAAHRSRVTVGKELSLVCYNDTPRSARLPTPLSFVRVPLDQIAGTAVDLIVNPGREPHIRRAMPTLIPPGIQRLPETHLNWTTNHTRRAGQAFQLERASDVPGLPVQKRVDGLSDAGGIHDVGKVVLARHRVLGHVGQSLPEVP
jgi:hypothetical protein